MKLEMKYKLGFTLLESCIALFIVSLIISTCMWISKIKWQQIISPEPIEIVQVTNELESQKHQFRLIEMKSDLLVLHSEVENKNYSLRFKDGKLKFSPGYMPLLLDVEGGNFKADESLIKINLKIRGNNYSTEVYIPLQKGQ